MELFASISFCIAITVYTLFHKIIKLMILCFHFFLYLFSVCNSKVYLILITFTNAGMVNVDAVVRSLPSDHKVPGSIPGFAEIRIFVQPSFSPKPTQLSILRSR